jgi:tetratricopeptide (TPR) repeat protein
VEYRILGPLVVGAGGRELNIGGPKQRRILALLLLRAGRSVDVDELAEAVWGAEVPPTGRRQVQNAIGALRTKLIKAGGVIDNTGAGYAVRVGRDELDAVVFDRMVTEARAAGDAKLMRAALARWRGPALAGLGGGGPLARAVAELEEARLAVLEDCLDLELAAGRHESAVAELSALVTDHPLRERLVGQLMTALQRSGRADEAEAVYAELAARLADELGIDPGPEVRRVYESIRSPEPVAGAVRPAQLPADVSAFAGRAGELARLDKVLADGPANGTVVISAIAGTAGVGKTALAVRWAHRVRDRFPDGQLHVNLRGYAQTEPMRPLDALSQFMRALGVPPEAIPTEVDEAAAMYRSTLAGKRVLVLLDNARSADQVRPLLPDDGDCIVLVTSRDQLDQLGGGRVNLDVLAADEARDLLVRVLGEDRVGAEPEAVDELARLCGYLPLALRIAAANVADGQSIAEYAEQLAAGNRLARLQVEGDRQAAVRSAFDLSYAALPGPAQRMFGLLGLVPGPDFTTEVAAALDATPVGTAQRLLSRLTAAHLIEQRGDRYTFHDLLRLYAAERARSEQPEDELVTALRRCGNYYLYAADAAARLLYPNKVRLTVPPRPEDLQVIDFDDHTVASTWLDIERANLVAIVRHFDPPVKWLLADTLRGYFWLRLNVVDWLTTARAALAAGEAHDALDAQAAAHLGLGDLHWHTGRNQEAISHYTASLALNEQLGSLPGQSAALTNLAGVTWQSGDAKRAAEQMQRGLEIDRRLGRQGGLATGLSNLALCYQELGRLTEALDLLGQALFYDRQSNSIGDEAATQSNLAVVYSYLGRFSEAIDCIRTSLDRAREVGDRVNESLALNVEALVYHELGRKSEALDRATAALAIAQDTAHPRLVSDALNTISGIQSNLGDLTAAFEGYREALRQSRANGSRYQQVTALIGLAVTYVRAHDLDRARACLGEALSIARTAGYRLFEGDALVELAKLDLDEDRPVETVEHAEGALAIHRETGHRPGEARALRVLGNGLAATGRDRAAEAAWQEAFALFSDMGMPEAGELAHQVRSSVARPETHP